MRALLDVAGSLVGWAGVIVCLGSGLLRVGGSYHLLGFETMTLFSAGLGLIVAGLLAKVEAFGMK